MLSGSSSSTEGAFVSAGALKHCPLFSVWRQRRHSHRRSPVFGACNFATRTRRVRVTEDSDARSEGWQTADSDTPTRWTVQLTPARQRRWARSAWPELAPVKPEPLTGLMVQLMLQHAAKSLTPTEREAGRDV